MKTSALNIVVLVAMAISSISLAQDTEDFYVPEGEASYTINEWSRQSGIQVLFNYDALKRWRTRTLHGTFDPIGGLERMLIDCPFDVEAVNDRTVSVAERSGPPICKPWLGADAPLPPCQQERA